MDSGGSAVAIHAGKRFVGWVLVVGWLLVMFVGWFGGCLLDWLLGWLVCYLVG